MKQIKTPKYRLNQNGFLRMDWQYEDDAIVCCPESAENYKCGIHCAKFALLGFRDRHSVTLHCCERVLDVEVE